MSVTDWKICGTGANVDNLSGTDWTNPTYIQADDTNYATNASSKGAPLDWLVGKNYGFSAADIPEGSTINGIEVIIYRKASAADDLYDDGLYLTKNGTSSVGSNLASANKWPTSFAEATYGGASELWGTTWTQAEIIANTFGVKLTLNWVSVGITAYVDYYKLRVHYTAPASSFTPRIMFF